MLDALTNLFIIAPEVIVGGIIAIIVAGVFIYEVMNTDM